MRSQCALIAGLVFPTIATSYSETSTAGRVVKAVSLASSTCTSSGVCSDAIQAADAQLAARFCKNNKDNYPKISECGNHSWQCFDTCFTSKDGIPVAIGPKIHCGDDCNNKNTDEGYVQIRNNWIRGIKKDNNKWTSAELENIQNSIESVNLVPIFGDDSNVAVILYGDTLYRVDQESWWSIGSSFIEFEQGDKFNSLYKESKKFTLNSIYSQYL